MPPLNEPITNTQTKPHIYCPRMNLKMIRKFLNKAKSSSLLNLFAHRKQHVMPLLSRYKSTSANTSPPGSPSVSLASRQQNQSKYQSQSSSDMRLSRAQQVCESPLFGTRRQVLLSSPKSQPSSPSAVSQNSSKQTTRSQSPQLDKQQPQTSDDDSNELSSIPKQITREQIHFAFSIMDTNKDGLIDLRDLSQMLANLGVPIDEAILSHVLMSKSASKKGNHNRLSEAEFIDWISKLTTVSDSPQPKKSCPNLRRSLRGTSGVSATASGSGSNPSNRAHSSTLVAQPTGNDALVMRRRGSGSGLALMRSLSSSGSSSNGPPSGAANNSEDRASIQSNSLSELDEARNDLKAAFCVFDLDGDGYITLDEVRAGLQLLGESWSPTELRNLFGKYGASSLDSDSQHQRISIDEFIRLLL